MKKLTLKQALKTPNIKFKVTKEQAQTVYEQSESWTCYTTLVMGFIIRSDATFNPIYVTEINNFNNCKYEEIEIVKEESNTFNSQQEVWKWLVEGNKCNYKSQWNKGTWVIGFKEGTLWNYTMIREFDCRSSPDINVSNWTKYIEPEYIVVNGFQVPKPIKQLSEFNLTNLLIEEGIHSNTENAYIHAQAMLGYME